MDAGHVSENTLYKRVGVGPRGGASLHKHLLGTPSSPGATTSPLVIPLVLNNDDF